MDLREQGIHPQLSLKTEKREPCSNRRCLPCEMVKVFANDSIYREEIFKERQVFKTKVIENVQSELNQFGLKM